MRLPWALCVFDRRAGTDTASCPNYVSVVMQFLAGDQPIGTVSEQTPPLGANGSARLWFHNRTGQVADMAQVE